MYEIFKIENGKLRKTSYWLEQRMFFNKSKRRLAKITKKLNTSKNGPRYVLLRVG